MITENTTLGELFNMLTPAARRRLFNPADNSNSAHDRQEIHLAYWSEFLHEFRPRADFARNITESVEPYLRFSTGARGVIVGPVVTAKEARVEIYISRGDKRSNKRVFEVLLAHRHKIEKSFGADLDWDRRDHLATSRVVIAKRGLNVYQRADWPAMMDFHGEAVLRMHNAVQEFVPLLRNV